MASDGATPIPTEWNRFEAFAERLIKRGFRIVPEREKKDYQIVEELVPPKGRKKRLGQTILVFNHISGLSVIVLTTFNMQTASLLHKGSAQAWVLIVEAGKKNPSYFSTPIRRTGKFWNKLLQMTIICHQRVVSVPICKCNCYMSVAMNSKAIGARFWRCKHEENHIGEKLPTADWDIGISKKGMATLQKKRKARDKYRKSRRAQGKDPNHSRFNRKRWSKKSPKTNS
jgi:hypothetical protein